jgi:hypothetical protein
MAIGEEAFGDGTADAAAGAADQDRARLGCDHGGAGVSSAS